MYGKISKTIGEDICTYVNAWIDEAITESKEAGLEPSYPQICEHAGISTSVFYDAVIPNDSDDNSPYMRVHFGGFTTLDKSNNQVKVIFTHHLTVCDSNMDIIFAVADQVFNLTRANFAKVNAMEGVTMNRMIPSCRPKVKKYGNMYVYSFDFVSDCAISTNSQILR